MPLPLTVSCSSKIQISFTFMVPVHLGSPGQGAVKQVCVCVCVCFVFIFCIFGSVENLEVCCLQWHSRHSLLKKHSQDLLVQRTSTRWRCAKWTPLIDKEIFSHLPTRCFYKWKVSNSSNLLYSFRIISWRIPSIPCFHVVVSLLLQKRMSHWPKVGDPDYLGIMCISFQLKRIC